MSDSIVLEEEIDPNYEPTTEEVMEYAKWLGMDIGENGEHGPDKDLIWIAREGLKAPLPENWKPCKTLDTKEIYYFNFQNGESTWDHPCDNFYRQLYEEEKKRINSKSAGPFTNKEQHEKEKKDVKNLVRRASELNDKERERLHGAALRQTEPVSLLKPKAEIVSRSGSHYSLGSSFGGGNGNVLNKYTPLPGVGGRNGKDKVRPRASVREAENHGESPLPGKSRSRTHRRRGDDVMMAEFSGTRTSVSTSALTEYGSMSGGDESESLSRGQNSNRVAQRDEGAIFSRREDNGSEGNRSFDVHDDRYQSKWDELNTLEDNLLARERDLNTQREELAAREKGILAWQEKEHRLIEKSRQELNAERSSLEKTQAKVVKSQEELEEDRMLLTEERRRIDQERINNEEKAEREVSFAQNQASEQVTKDLEEKEGRLADLREEITVAQRELDTIKEKQALANSKLGTLQVQVRDAERVRDALEVELCQKSRDKKGDDCEEGDMAAPRASETEQALREQRAQIREEERASVAAEMDQLRSKAHADATELAQAMAKRHQIESELREERTKVASLEQQQLRASPAPRQSPTSTSSAASNSFRLELLVKERKEVEDQLQVVRDALKEADDQNALHKSNARSLDSKIKSLERDLLDAQREIEGDKSELGELRTDLDRANRERHEALERARTSNAARLRADDDANFANEALQKQTESGTETLAELKAAKRRELDLGQKVKQLESSLRMRETELAETQQAKGQLEQENGVLEKQKIEADVELRRLDSEGRALKTKAAALGEKLKHETQKSVQQLAQVEAKFVARETDFESLSGDKRALADRIAALENEAEQANAKSAQASSEANASKTRVRELEHDLHEARQIASQASQEQERLKQRLVAAQADRADALVGQGGKDRKQQQWELERDAAMNAISDKKIALAAEERQLAADKRQLVDDRNALEVQRADMLSQEQKFAKQSKELAEEVRKFQDAKSERKSQENALDIARQDVSHQQRLLDEQRKRAQHQEERQTEASRSLKSRESALDDRERELERRESALGAAQRAARERPSVLSVSTSTVAAATHDQSVQAHLNDPSSSQTEATSANQGIEKNEERNFLQQKLAASTSSSLSRKERRILDQAAEFCQGFAAECAMVDHARTLLARHEQGLARQKQALTCDWVDKQKSSPRHLGNSQASADSRILIDRVRELIEGQACGIDDSILELKRKQAFVENLSVELNQIHRLGQKVLRTSGEDDAALREFHRAYSNLHRANIGEWGIDDDNTENESHGSNLLHRDWPADGPTASRRSSNNNETTAAAVGHAFVAFLQQQQQQQQHYLAPQEPPQAPPAVNYEQQQPSMAFSNGPTSRLSHSLASSAPPFRTSHLFAKSNANVSQGYSRQEYDRTTEMDSVAGYHASNMPPHTNTLSAVSDFNALQSKWDMQRAVAAQLSASLLQIGKEMHYNDNHVLTASWRSSRHGHTRNRLHKSGKKKHAAAAAAHHKQSRAAQKRK